MHISVEASLKKLRTSYIDLFYVHWWDYETSIKEVMDGLHSLVMQGKVLYLVSNALRPNKSIFLMLQYREFPILLHGLWLKLMSTLDSLEKHRSRFTRDCGTSLTGPSNVKSFLWLVRKVCHVNANALLKLAESLCIAHKAWL
jgi:hypothetical protein